MGPVTRTMCLAAVLLSACGETSTGTLSGLGDNRACITKAGKQTCHDLSPAADVEAVPGQEVVVRMRDGVIINIDRASE